MIRRAVRGAESGGEAGSGTVAAGMGGKNTLLLPRGRNAVELPGSLIAAEEEQLVLLDGPPNDAAELVLLQNLLFPAGCRDCRKKSLASRSYCGKTQTTLP